MGLIHWSGGIVRLAAVYFIVSDDADPAEEDNSKQNAYTQK